MSPTLKRENDKLKSRSKSKGKPRPKSLVLDTRTLSELHGSAITSPIVKEIRRASLNVGASNSPQQFAMSPLSLNDFRRRLYCSDECYLRDQRANSVAKPQIISPAPSREPSLSLSATTDFSPTQLTTPLSEDVYELKRDIKIEMPWFKFRSRRGDFYVHPRPKFDDTDDETTFDHQQQSTVILVKRPLSRVAKIRLEMEKESLMRARQAMGEMQWLDHDHSSQPLPWWQQEDKEDWETYWKAREEDSLDISLREWTLRRRKQRETQAAKEERQEAYYSDVRLTLRPDSRKVADRPFLIRQASQPTMSDPNIRSYPSVRMSKDKIESLKREAEFRRSKTESVPQSPKPFNHHLLPDTPLPRSPIVKGFNIDADDKVDDSEHVQRNAAEGPNEAAPQIESEASQEIWIHEATLTASPTSLNIEPPALFATTTTSFNSLSRNKLSTSSKAQGRPDLNRCQSLGATTNVSNTQSVVPPSTLIVPKLASSPETSRLPLGSQSRASNRSRPSSVVTTCIDGDACIEGPAVAKKRTLPPILVMAHASVSTCSTPGTPFDPTLSPLRPTHVSNEDEVGGSPQIHVENGSGSGSSGEDSNWSPPDVPAIEARQGKRVSIFNMNNRLKPFPRHERTPIPHRTEPPGYISTFASSAFINEEPFSLYTLCSRQG
jgi:hypothetical protein